MTPWQIRTVVRYRDYGLLPDTHTLRVLCQPTPDEREELQRLRVPEQAIGSKDAVQRWMATRGAVGALQ